VVALVVLAASSVLWSVDPAMTMRRSILLAVKTGFGLYLVSSFSLLSILRIVALTFGLTGGLSLVAGFVMPEWAIMPDQRGMAWRGIFLHKNILGETMMWAGLAALLLTLSQKQHRSLYLGVFLLAVNLSILSESSTSLVITVLLIPAVWCAVLLRKLAAPLLLASACIASAAGLLLTLILITNAESALALIGRDTTLTGRLALWEAVWDQIVVRVWVGYGYGAFWDGPLAPGQAVREAVGWYANAHNGWLEVWLGLGLAGTVLMLASFFSSLFRATRTFAVTREWTALVIIVVLLALFLMNLVESKLLTQYTVSWIFYIIACTSINGPVERVRSSYYRFHAKGA
jgi:O-antigen ligase